MGFGCWKPHDCRYDPKELPDGRIAFSSTRSGDPRATPSLPQAVANLDNALDVRHSAAQALVLLGDRSHLHELQGLATDCPEVATRRLLLEACARARSMNEG